MNIRDRFTGLPVELYRRSPLWYWLRFVSSDPIRLSLGGRHYREDFWFRVNQGWYDIQP